MLQVRDDVLAGDVGGDITPLCPYRLDARRMMPLATMPYVPFKSDAVGTSSSSTWNRLFHYFNLHRDEFSQVYHARSNAESAFSAMKRKFGDSVRSKTPVAQTNEALLKVLCHNIVCVIHEMHEQGIDAEFGRAA